MFIINPVNLVEELLKSLSRVPLIERHHLGEIGLPVFVLLVIAAVIVYAISESMREKRETHEKHAEGQKVLIEEQRVLQKHNNAVLSEPRNPGVYLERATFHQGRGNYQKAFDDCAAAIRLQPHEYRAYLQRAKLCEGTGNYTDAVKNYSQAINILRSRKPEHHVVTLRQTFYARAWAYRKLGDYEKSLEDDLTSEKFDPEYAQTYIREGIEKSVAGHYEEAIAEFGAAIELQPQSAPSHYYRALVYDRLNQTDLALKDYETACSLDSDMIKKIESQAQSGSKTAKAFVRSKVAPLRKKN